MDISSTRDQAIDYAPCRYGGSRLWFRGPRRSLRASYIACVGGCGVYGRYVPSPWSQILEDRVGRTVVNLGIENAGIDAYLNDPGALATAANASVVVIQMTCAHNTSNRFYATHPRRNDRFLKASPSLMSLYPEMDFTDIHFTRHLLGRLHGICPDRFRMVAQEVQMAWQSRMKSLVSRMHGEVFLLWFAPTSLDDIRADIPMEEPFLDRELLRAVMPHAKHLIEVVPSDWRTADEVANVPLLEQHRARHLPGLQAHCEVAEAVARAIVPALQ